MRLPLDLWFVKTVEDLSQYKEKTTVKSWRLLRIFDVIVGQICTAQKSMANFTRFVVENTRLCFYMDCVFLLKPSKICTYLNQSQIQR